MKLAIKKQLSTRSDRVKGVDFHPTEPWGNVTIWSYESQSIVKTFEVASVPVRAGRFIARKNWIVVGSDDFQIRVYNYNTSEKVAQFEAHPDYIRSIAVHPSQSFILSASDDMTIKMWNWEKDWRCTQVFEGHSHFVMSIAINPKDTNTFASACLDRTVKIWSFNSPVANYTLDAHSTRGVNFVDYYPLADKPYLITASDDCTVKIWDYQTKACVATLEGHTRNVSFAVFHPELPVIISGAEDSTIKIWHSSTFRLEQTISYNLDRAWCVATRKGSNSIAMGFDEGSVVIALGREDPAVSMDPNGKVVWSRHAEVSSAVIKGTEAVADGEQLNLSQKELGSVEVYPTQLVHSPNGRFIAVCGDGEYIIYTALAWRNKSFGSGLEFAWAQDSNEYAVLESSTSVRLFKNFKEVSAGHLHLSFACDGIFGGTLLGIKGEEGITFFDWESGLVVRRIDVYPRLVVWSDDGALVTLITEDGFYVLRYSRDEFITASQSGTIDEEEGVAEAFEVVADLADVIRTGIWVGDCFIYTTVTNRLNYLVGNKTYTISHFDSPLYLLGYLPKVGRIYLVDKDLKIVSYGVSLSVIEYQTLVLRGDMEQAAELLSTVPDSDRTKIARFLEDQGYTDIALEVSQDAEHKFELALGLNRLDIATEIAEETQETHKWRSIGDKALGSYDVELAQKSFEKSNDLGSLLLVYTSTNDIENLKLLAEKALKLGLNNIAFSAYWASGNVKKCVDLLESTNRKPEAIFLAKTYGVEVPEVL